MAITEFEVKSVAEYVSERYDDYFRVLGDPNN